MDNIGQRLREERQFRGWSQRDLAREAGVNVDTISGIETGEHEPRPSTLRKLAEGLGIEVRDLFMESALPKGPAREAGQPETRQDRGFTTSRTREFRLPKESPAPLAASSPLMLPHEEFARVVDRTESLQDLKAIAQQIKTDTEAYLSLPGHDPARPVARAGYVLAYVFSRYGEEAEADTRELVGVAG